MLEISVLGSGSRGNATLVRTEQTAVLIDAGFTCKQITLRMAEAGWSPDRLDGIVVSHEHIDHIRGLRVLNRRHEQTLYASEATLDTPEVQAAEMERMEPITAGEPFTIGDISITPFTIPHDAADPLGFVIEAEGIKFGHVTDIGFPTELARHHLRGCHAMVLESNHDRDMLINGPYPWPVKQRIMSRTGHLENADAAGLLADVMHSDLQTVLLAHLSQENNSPDSAASSAEAVIEEKANGHRPKVIVTRQNTPSETIRF